MPRRQQRLAIHLRDLQIRARIPELPSRVPLRGTFPIGTTKPRCLLHSQHCGKRYFIEFRHTSFCRIRCQSSASHFSFHRMFRNSAFRSRVHKTDRNSNHLPKLVGIPLSITSSTPITSMYSSQNHIRTPEWIWILVAWQMALGNRGINR